MSTIFVDVILGTLEHIACRAWWVGSLACTPYRSNSKILTRHKTRRQIFHSKYLIFLTSYTVITNKFFILLPKAHLIVHHIQQLLRHVFSVLTWLKSVLPSMQQPHPKQHVLLSPNLSRDSATEPLKFCREKWIRGCCEHRNQHSSHLSVTYWFARLWLQPVWHFHS